MLKLIILVIISINISSSYIDKLSPEIEIKESIWKRISDIVFSSETGIPYKSVNLGTSIITIGKDNTFEFREELINITKMQDKITLKKYLSGYIGAMYNSDLKKAPYAYAYVVQHSKGDAFKQYYENNKLEKIIYNIKKGLKTTIRFSIFRFLKLEYKKYKVLSIYSIKDLTGKVYHVRHIMYVDIERSPFSFQVYKETITIQ